MSTKKAIEKKYICYDGEKDRLVGCSPWDMEALIDKLVATYGGNKERFARLEIYEIVPTCLKIKLNVELVKA